jgi:hypothetical protein
LPKPNGIGESAGNYARVDENGKWPVDPGTINEAPYTTDTSLEYSVSDLGNIELTGSSDPIPTTFPGVSAPFTVKQAVNVGSPHIIRIGTEPMTEDLGDCSKQSKRAFHALVGLFQLNKYIDFQEYDAGCQVCDPQGPTPQPTCPSVLIVQARENSFFGIHDRFLSDLHYGMECLLILVPSVPAQRKLASE